MRYGEIRKTRGEWFYYKIDISLMIVLLYGEIRKTW